MRAFFTPHFRRNYQKLPKAIRRAFGKQLVHLLRDIRHPSLRAKKYDEHRNLWQARVTGNWRFYFEIKTEMYILHEIHKHAD